MPVYDFLCPRCHVEKEMAVPIALRNLQLCEKCGGSLERLFSPPKHIQVHELHVYPFTDDNVDGVRRTFENKKKHKAFVRHYNEEQVEKGRPKWQVALPALEN